MGLFRKSRKKAVRKNFRKRAKAADSVRTSEEKAAAGQVTGPEEGSEPEEKTLEKAGEIAAKADPSRVFYYLRQIFRCQHHSRFRIHDKQYFSSFLHLCYSSSSDSSVSLSP